MTAIASTASNKSGFFIGVGCPGCGGELKIESDLFVVGCEHCGSSLRITMPDAPPAFMVSAKTTKREARFGIDRYLKKKNLPLTGSELYFKYLYYPYWKIDAVLLKVRNQIERRDIYSEDDCRRDNTYERQKTEISLTPYMTTVQAGCDFEGIPDALGMRAGYVELVPYSRANTQDDFDSLPVTKPWMDSWSEVITRVRAIGELARADFGMNKTELFRPTASLVYFPYIIVESYAGNDFNRFTVDGVTGRVLNHIQQLSLVEQADSAEVPEIKFGQLGVELHRCTNCGEDLPAKQSFVYICENCHELIALESHTRAVSRIAAAVADRNDADPAVSVLVSQDRASRQSETASLVRRPFCLGPFGSTRISNGLF